MSLGLYGLTLYNGTILINNKFCQNSDLNNSPYICIILLTLLHEIAHASIRIFREDKNYFYNTFLELNKKTDNSFINRLNINNYLKKKVINESGFLFEELLLWNEFENNNITNYKYITHFDSIFLLTYNYNRDNYKIFSQSFKINRNISGSENLPTYLKFSVEKKNASLIFYLSPERCINANLRFK